MRGFAFFDRVSKAFHDYPKASKMLVVVAVSGGSYVAYAEATPEPKLISSAPVIDQVDNKKQKIVILGTGWAGTSFLRNLKNSNYEVQIISPRNYFAFTPLLPSVTCGTVEARSIVEPIRNIVRKKNVDVQFTEAACLKIDAQNKKIYCHSNLENNLDGQEDFVVDFDYLIIAVGANVNTFNTPGVMENCHFLKEVEDAQKIRRTVIDCFEKASLPTVSDGEKKRILHFAVVGGGPTGVEFAAELHDFVNEDLVKLYPGLKDLIISPRNYFAFTPLLPSVTCGTVEARSIVEPIRNIVRKKNVDVQFTEAACLKIDAQNKKIYCHSNLENNLDGQEDFVVDFDYLIIAVGANVNTFNTPGVMENCHFLKEVEDAQKIRRTVIDCFEKASLPTVSDGEKKRILHFAVVGGGPTGVEFAAELHDFVNEDLVKLYPGLKDLVRITILEAGDHILNMFDKRITSFAEGKFQRDGINLKTGSMVVKVTDKEIFTKEMKNGGEVSAMPYGMALWSTGIGTRPFIKDFMTQVGQGNRRALATDEWLRVEGCDKVYAIGDCATINQRKVMEDIAAIFRKADKDNSGTLTIDEYQEVIKDICERYPQVELYLKSKQMKNMVDLLKETADVSKGNVELNIEDFKTALSKVDSQMKNLPATAQVAAQQGVYLAKCFNRMEEAEKNPEGPLRFRGEGRHRFQPFRYKHLGQFAPLGGEQTAAQLPGDWVSIGRSSQWLWYSVYASKQVSWRNRALVVTDWARRFIWGRDSSRI